MKKVKLLTSLTALVLALSVCGCSETSTDEEEKPSQEDSGTSETTPEAVTSVSNLTLSISFTDDSGSITLPSGVSAYILGSWDSYKEFLPLTLSESSYSYTFSKINLGSYSYRVYVWYTGEDVSLTRSEEVSISSLSFEVGEDDSGAIKSATLSYNVVLPELGVLESSEAVNTASTILGAIPSGTYLDEYSWDGVHVEASDKLLDDKEVYYLYREVSSYETLTGAYVIGDTAEESADLSSFSKGYKYSYGWNDDAWDYCWSMTKAGEYEDSFESLISDYSDPLLDASDILSSIQQGTDDSGESITYSISRGAGTYIIEFSSESSGSYTYTSDWEYNLIGFSYDDEDGESYSVEELSRKEVEKGADSLKQYFDARLDIGDLFRQEYFDANYYQYFAWEPSIGINGVRWGDYKAAQEKAARGDSSDLNALDKILWSEGIGFWFQDSMWYTEEAFLVKHSCELWSVYGGVAEGYYTYDLYVNGDGVVDVYYSEDCATWDYVETKDGSWKDYFWYLGTGYENDTFDGMSISRVNTSRADGSHISYWNIKDNYLGDYLKAMGGDAMLGQDRIEEYCNSELGELSLYNLYYTPAYQDWSALSSFLYWTGLIYFDDVLTDDTIVYVESANFSIQANRFGAIDMRDEIEMEAYNRSND